LGHSISSANRASEHTSGVDATGIGRQLGEALYKRFQLIEPVYFHHETKNDMAVTMKRLLEQGKLQIPDDQELISDFHSVRRTTTASANIKYEVDRSQKGHADRFWAYALALRAGQSRAATWVVR